MSKDIIPQEEPKRSKKDKKDKKAKKSADPVSEETRAEKKDKEHKKKKHHDPEDITAVSERAKMDIDPPEGRVKNKKKSVKAVSNVEESAVEIAVDVPSDPKDKEKKRKIHTETSGDADPIPDGERTSKKLKKRKHDGTQETDSADKPSPSKKHKKKKHDHEADTPSANAAMTSQQPLLATPSSQPSTKSCSPAEAEAFLEKHNITISTQTNSDAVIPVISFDQLNIPDGLRGAFTGFNEPTPIQACTWPPALKGKDVVGIAETGSGKTLAFGIPALAQLIASPQKPKKKETTISVLVVAPTRELAIQTHDALSALGAPFGIASVAVFGGVPKDPQVKALANGNTDGKITRIVVGTPGRIIDLVNDGVCDLSRVNYLVLDEADRMLDKGFENDITKIISYTIQGEGRQTMMFSATWPEAVRRLASSFQHNPVRVTVGSDDLTANSRVEQVVEVFDDPREKDNRLLKCLKDLSHKKTSRKGSDEARILIFALYKKEATRIEQSLRRAGYDVGALHGDMSQTARMNALEKFKTGETGLLVATDVAARGLDIPNVGAVINYTFPLTLEDYIHRIGRTGRGGRSGKSITFFTGENHERALAGELARVLREGGFDTQADNLKQFPMTIKKKGHAAYGAFFRDDITAAPTKIVF
ncbi:P-loop containing nucleoside triphosphate hydrolase protein [Suillus bovinus]|uniref:P-loop containing nucleoside triphosphate hydrolase protein n=1 Tax=Suillus bovinus TaxID=48563 RepID=UPI001B873689|nr:P-loop containing nucleoside triphosphate hydrolase protein [Suillus bovinus]KAG2160241.1 P-loop containing nucleoside triphosphate hydrolase protein [Suillus bovinus]